MNEITLASSNKCRWNPIEGNNLIAIKYALNKLNGFDSEKGCFVLKKPIIIHEGIEFFKRLTKSSTELIC